MRDKQFPMLVSLRALASGTPQKSCFCISLIIMNSELKGATLDALCNMCKSKNLPMKGTSHSTILFRARYELRSSMAARGFLTI